MKITNAPWSPVLPMWIVLAAIGLQIACAPSANSQLIEPIAIPASEKQRVKFWLDQAWKKNLDNRTQSVELYE